MERLSAIAMWVAIAAVLIVLARWSWPLFRGRLGRAAPRPVVPQVSARSHAFRGATYEVAIEPDRTAVWRADRTAGARSIPAAQDELATLVFARLDDILLDAALGLLESHRAWLEDEHATTRGRLAAELRPHSVRIPPDVRDATVHARHPAFSGHVVEIGVRPNGRVFFVGLLG